jgi:hypothetical protein
MSESESVSGYEVATREFFVLSRPTTCGRVVIVRSERPKGFELAGSFLEVSFAFHLQFVGDGFAVGL